MSNLICKICEKEEAKVEHHISYRPEIKISVCFNCHKKIHSGERKKDRLRLISLKLLPLHVDRIDEFVNAGLYASRSEFIRRSVIAQLEYEERPNTEKALFFERGLSKEDEASKRNDRVVSNDNIREWANKK